MNSRQKTKISFGFRLLSAFGIRHLSFGSPTSSAFYHISCTLHLPLRFTQVNSAHERTIRLLSLCLDAVEVGTNQQKTKTKAQHEKQRHNLTNGAGPWNSSAQSYRSGRRRPAAG